MLEGLEITVLDFSFVRQSISDFRIHSEFFTKENLLIEGKINKLATVTLGEVSSISDGDHAKFPENQLDEIPYLQARDITNNFLERTSNSYVSKSYFIKNYRSRILPESILLSIMGTVGDITITPKDFTPCMCNRALAIIRDIHILSPQYLFIYLTTKFSFNEIERLKNGGVQQRINLDVLHKLRIPALSTLFQKKIEFLTFLAQDTRKESKQTYAQAEEILLKEIGLLGFEPSRESVNIKSFTESFASTGRIDAEYYQPKYDDYLHLVKAYHHGCEPVSQACTPRLQNFTPESSKEYHYIELSNIGKTGDINGCTTALGEELPSRARRRVNRHDVIVSSIEGSLDSCALVTEEYHDALCSTGFYVLQPKKLNAETLLVLFKSELMQSLLKQGCSGTILTAINKDEFLGLPIPLIDKDTQKNIAALIQQSFALKQQSEHLLEVAKRAVEIAIEEDEDAALCYIEENKG